ncbi:glycine cleavage system aminomethyltransferase GcvT [Tepidicaulis sp. LMO-SS28]|uniref:glycine cleavage system aminomethyltransferase GcvT n=1 Tax=Tepidicaulis sp. LMO-SS28 TaxID=3447455 RepID=UPI003EE1B006
MSESPAAAHEDLKKTPLHALHVELGARMVPFAGFDMPVQYPKGVLGEHLHTREAAGLFDVSHMGQAMLVGPDHETVAAALETLCPGNFKGLGEGRQVYSLLLTDEGTIIDDLMVARPAAPEEAGRLLLVVNAACKEKDYAHIAGRLPGGVTLEPLEDRALLALQGPKAGTVMAAHAPETADMVFMDARRGSFDGIPCHFTRSGYTGEDGFEISVPADKAEEVARALLAHPEVEAIGLGARDSLRLEAGLCLYGHDIDDTTTPVEAALMWAIPKRRREEANFPGAKIILGQLENGAEKRRVGILPDGKAPAREGTEIHSSTGEKIGVVTSGGFGPSVGGPIAMGYVRKSESAPDTELVLMVRGKERPARIATLPFVAQRYHRGSK